MIEFGKTLRSAREAKGYTASQVAEMTHIKPSVLDGLENEDFSMIAAPIYGRGFVKLYCEAVGLEPKPLVDEFMAIMNGEREITIKERPVAESPAAAAEPPPPPPPTPVPAPEEPDLFRQDSLPPPAPTPAVPSPADKTEPAFSRFAAPMREYTVPDRLNFINPRIIILAIAGIALLVLLVFGIRALYCATSSDHAAEAQESAEAETPATPKTVPTAAAKANAAPRTQQKIPSLYID